MAAAEVATPSIWQQRLDNKFQSDQIVEGWQIGKRLGYGGFSFAHQARRPVSGVNEYGCAKFTRHKESARHREQQISEINTELEALGTIDHANVVKILDYHAETEYTTRNGQGITCYMIVLELCPGGDLFDILYYTGPLDEKVSRTIFSQIVSGVRACHDVRVCHRDIKAQNVTLDQNYRAKIIDFGSSKQWQSRKQMSTHRVGTKGYQAPELLVQVGYTYKCDVFSLGVLLFVMLTRSVPFTEASREDRRFRMLARGKYKDFWKSFAKFGISDEGKDLIQHMLMYQPQERATMDEVANHEWFSMESTPASEVSDKLDQLHARACADRNKDSGRAVQNYNSLAGQVGNFRGDEHNPPPSFDSLSPWEKKFAFQMDAALEDPLKLLKMYEIYIQNTLQGLVQFNEEEYEMEITLQFKKQTKPVAESANDEEEEEEEEVVTSAPPSAKARINVYSEDLGNDEFRYWIRFTREFTENTNDELYGLLLDKLEFLKHGTVDRHDVNVEA